MANAVACFCLLAVITGRTAAQTRPGGFTVIGPGGGGAMFNPTISPHDAKTVLVSCDMTGAYITHDGGNSWRMFNLRGVVHFFVFDPIDFKTIYAGTNILWRSSDDGETWSLVYPKPSTVQGLRMNPDHADETILAQPDSLGAILALAIDPDDHGVLYAATGKGKSFAVLVSRDFGSTWKELDRLSEEPRGMWIDPHSPRESRTLFVASRHFLTLKNSSGLPSFGTPSEFSKVSLGFGTDGGSVIYGTSEQGLFVSRDRGASWQRSDLPGSGAQVRTVATSLHHPQTAYVSYSHLQESMQSFTSSHSAKQWMGVARTTDAGKTWQLVWKESDKPAANVHDAWISERFGPGWAENPLQLGVAEQDPELCYGTDFGRTLQTSDGGANWTAVYSRRVPGAQWTSTGLDVTTSYGIHFDPFDPKRQFITYTDIGLFRSEDGGTSWQSSTAGVPQEWLNTTYWMVFDPSVRGRIWSVNSATHDLPRPKMWRHRSVLDYKGGVCRSDDGGKTWVKSNHGMDETAPTHIVVDPGSPPDARILYVAAFGRGVYKSSDGGRTWRLKNKGISQPQPLAWRLTLHPSGTLYVILARRSEDGSIGNDGDGAIYRSRDGAENWEPVSLPAGTNGPNGLALDPRMPNRLYLAAWARAAGTHGDGGGVFLSEDGGKNWRQVLDRDRHVYDVTADLREPDWLYAAGFESSAWRSVDRGEHWSRIPGFNFKWGHRVTPDPADQHFVYVTTFGGSVWHGAVDGKPAPLDIRTPELQLAP
jgi:photosystem II stability/assembly factor-like uncharacterized protein